MTRRTSRFRTVMAGAFVSSGYCNKLPQPWWHEAAEMYSTTVWKLKVQNQGARTVLSLQAPRENPTIVSPSFWWLQCSLAGGCVPSIPSSVVTSPPPILCMSVL